MDDAAPAHGPVRRVLLKSGVAVLAVLCLTYLPYLVLGLWNRVFGGWRSVFFCYAGSRNYVTTYAPRGPLVRAFVWRPSAIGVLRQGGSWGLVLAAPVSEAEFLDPANAAAFDRLLRRIRRVAWLVGVEEINLAGILPGVLRAHPDMAIRDTRPLVVAAVVAATAELVARRFGGEWPALIVLGGAGHVGTPIVASLRAAGRTVHVVDPRGREGPSEAAPRPELPPELPSALPPELPSALPPELHGTPALLIDVARKGVLARYADQVWPGLVILNETFPRPTRRDVARLHGHGAEMWHLSGLAGRVIPPLPFGYENAVPCCASHVAGDPPRVRVIALSVEAAPPITPL